jgi:hypothetical protein
MTMSRSRPIPRLPIVRWLAVLGLCLLCVAPGRVLAQSHTDQTEVYRSPEFGYLLWWWPGEWTVEGQSSEPGADWIQLSYEDTIVDLWGINAPGVIAESCLREGLDLIANVPEIARFASLSDPNADPEVVVLNEGLTAQSDLVLAFETDDGRATFAARESCTAIEPGASLLYTSEWIPAETYNAQLGQVSYPVNALLSRLTMPRSHWSFAQGGVNPIVAESPNALPANVTRVLSSHGTEQGLLSLHDTCQDFLAADPVVVIENSGFADLEISPNAFFAVDGFGAEVAPIATRWLTPAPNGASPVVLARGEIAMLQLEFATEDVYDHFYRDPTVGAMALGSTISGCGAGGGAPIVIDME